MRSRRYKKHNAASSLTFHVKAGWHIMPEYPLKGPYLHLEYYQIKNHEWWHTVHRWDWKFVNDFDRKNFIFSNMELRKNRCGKKYEMYRGGL